MNVAVAEFTKSLLQKEDLTSTTVAELEQLVNRYPYFLPARLLYLKKLQAAGEPTLAAELRKAEIWVPNTAWLDQLLYDTGTVALASELSPDPARETALPVDASEEGHDRLPAEIAPNEEHLVATENPAVEVVAAEKAESTLAEQDNMEAVEPAFDPLTGLPGANQNEGNSFDEMNRYDLQEPVQAADDVIVAGSNVPDGKTGEETGKAAESEVEADSEVAADSAVVAGSDAIQAGVELELIPGPGPEDGENDKPSGESTDTVVLSPWDQEAAARTPNLEESRQVWKDEDDADDPAFEPGKEDIEFKIAPFREEPMPAGNELTFEPFHTVDYFASQGIQAKEDDKPADRFSQQLKSFTQWLKAMKKIPTVAAAGAGGQEEKKIEEMAEYSVKGREVVTEAMAEVWIKQGNPERARVVYEKLSLLDPAKSAYFAAKIEQLKFL